MKMKIDGSILLESVKAISELVTETELVATPDELSIIAMDPANVAMVVFKMHNTAFVEYNVDAETKIGLNLLTLKQLLKRVKGNDIVSLELKNNQLHVKIGNYKAYEMPILALDNRIQKVPELSFKAKITMPTAKLSELIEDTEIIAEAIGFEALDNKKITVKAEGDLSKANIEVWPMTDDKAKTKIVIDCTEPAKSKFSIEYLKKMCHPKLGSEVVLHFSKDYPLKLVYVNDKVSLQYILAPRVDNS